MCLGVIVKRVAQCELFASRVNCDAVDGLHIPRTSMGSTTLWWGWGRFSNPGSLTQKGHEFATGSVIPGERSPCPLPSAVSQPWPFSCQPCCKVWRLAEESPYPTVISWYRLCPWEKGQPRSLEGRLFEISWLLRCTSQTRSSAQLTAGQTHTRPWLLSFLIPRQGRLWSSERTRSPDGTGTEGPLCPMSYKRASGKAGSKLTLLAFPCDLGKVPPVFCLVSPSCVERNRDVMAVPRLCCRHKRHTHAL